MVAFLLWCILFVLSWPLAILVLMLWPLVWLISLPFKLLGYAIGGVFALMKSILLLPARIFGWRPSPQPRMAA